MAKVLPLLAAIVLLGAFGSTPARGQSAGSGSVLRADFQSGTLSRTYQYVGLPPGYDESAARYPVIYLLHGRGDVMDSWLEARTVLDDLIANGDIPPIIAVLPDMPSSERAGYYIDSQYTGSLYRAEAVETAFMHDLIPHIEATYRALTNREARLVGGYSMGGYGAIRYSMAYPESFVGALVLSPAVYLPLPPADSSTREFGAFGTGAALFDEAIYKSLNYPPSLTRWLPANSRCLCSSQWATTEWKNPNPEIACMIDMEAHMFFNHVARHRHCAVRIPRVQRRARLGGVAAWFRERSALSRGLHPDG